MSRYDIETGALDAMSARISRYPKWVDFALGWLVATVIYAVTMVVPCIAALTWYYVGGFDPDSGLHVVATWIGAPAVVAAFSVWRMDCNDRCRSNAAGEILTRQEQP